MRATCIVALAALAGACSRPAEAPRTSQPAPARSAAPAIAREVERITGAVSAANAEAFARRVSDQDGQIIGLKLSVEPGTDADFKASRYLAEPSGELFVISTGDGDAEGDGWEVVLPKGEASLLHGAYVVDGFYQVKAGGMHQGIVSYGLEKVDPAGVLLNPSVAVRDKPLP